VNDLRPFREGKDIAEFQRNELQLYSANIEWDAGPVTARSITGYVRPTFNTLQDADFSPKNLGALNLVEQAKQFSQEFQLLSNAAGSAPFTWIVGAFYFHEKASRESRFLGGRYQTIATANQVPYGFLIGGDVEAESYAAFRTSHVPADG
jgi:iron complex outermembrane receptor protein